MPRPLTLLIPPAAALLGPPWLAAKRLGYRRHSRILTLREKAPLAGYFSPGLLAAVRIAEVHRINLVAPLPVRAGGRISGAAGLLASPAGLALDDLIVVATARTGLFAPPSLLFHEMVHVVQWRTLGRARFLREYLGGWAAAGRDYWSIPLEQMAYELQERYEREPAKVFDAESEVRRRLA